jgi:hypothetical protein
MLCWKDPVNQMCYPITENNLNFWATLHVSFYTIYSIVFIALTPPKVKDPDLYPADKKPDQINLYNNSARKRPHGNHNAGSQQMPQGQQMPYGYYPSPFIPAWYPGSGYPHVLPPPQQPMQPLVQQPIAPPAPAPAPAPAQVPKLMFPFIVDWLQHCDSHNDRRGHNFEQYTNNFNDEGFIRINQLNRNRVTIEQLAEWLNIKKGTADLLIGYAEEDCELVKCGEFKLAHLEEERRQLDEMMKGF